MSLEHEENSDDLNASLSMIDKYNQAIETAIRNDDLINLPQIYDVRNNIIEACFEKHMNEVSEDLNSYFKELKDFDAEMQKILENKKSSLSESAADQKKVKAGLQSYKNVSTDKKR